MPGRLLLVCYHYGPHGHTGGFRWRSFCRHLVAAGWKIDAICVETAESVAPGTVDDVGVRCWPVSPRWSVWDWQSRRMAGRGRAADDGTAEGSVALDDVPDDDTVSSLAGRARAAVNGALDLANGAVWARRAMAVASVAIDGRRPDVIVSTSPEPAAHAVGRALKRRTGAPLVMEYRDPWYFGRGKDIGRLDRITRLGARRAELACLDAADAVVDIAQGAQRDSIDELCTIAPALAHRPRYFVPSGYDAAPVLPLDRDVFRIAYTGWFWPFMPVVPLLRGVGRFASRHPEQGPRISLDLVGVEPDFNGADLKSMGRSAGLADRMSVRGRLPRAEARALQERAAVKVAFDSVCPHGICIPSKLYHYAQCHGTLLSVGRPDGAMAEEAAKIGVATLDPDDIDGIAAMLEDAFEAWRTDAPEHPIDTHGAFDAAHRARELEAILTAVASSGGPVGLPADAYPSARRRTDR